jgi:sulfite exporter TauE/SafE
MEAFLLGLANGTVCLAFCAPVLIPFLLAEGKTTPANFGLMGEFLLGRLVGYLGFGAIAWITNSLILAKTSFREMVMGGVYMILAVFLVAFSLRPEHKPCGGQWLTRQSGRFHSDISQWFSLVLGLLTGLNLCPPFLLAFAGAAGSGSLGSSVFFFLCFFLGTSLFFLPLPFIGLVNRHQTLRWVGRLSAAVVGVYYFYAGLIMFGGGWYS